MAALPRCDGIRVSGITLSRVSRILSAGHGDQVLLSLTTAELVSDRLPREVTLRDLGEHLLRDLAQPQRIFQLAAPGLRREFPSLGAQRATPYNLPSRSPASSAVKLNLPRSVSSCV